jgi:hypothetical protein
LPEAINTLSTGDADRAACSRARSAVSTSINPPAINTLTRVLSRSIATPP